MGDQAVAHGVLPGPGDALTEEPNQGLGNAIPTPPSKSSAHASEIVASVPHEHTPIVSMADNAPQPDHLRAPRPART